LAGRVRQAAIRRGRAQGWSCCARHQRVPCCTAGNVKLIASVHAFGGKAEWAAIAVVYLAGAASSQVRHPSPTPHGGDLRSVGGEVRVDLVNPRENAATHVNGIREPGVVRQRQHLG